MRGMTAGPVRPEEPDPGDRGVKRGRLLALLAQSGHERLVLTSAGAVSWYLDGIRSHVKVNADGAVLACVVSAEADRVIIPRNEVDRLLTEELPTGVEVTVREWWQPLLDDDLAPGAAGVARESDPSCQAGLRAARASLLPDELRRYRRLCADAAEVMTQVAGSPGPRDTERQVASLLGAELLARGADPVVLLVAGEERLHHRHPLPTNGPLGRLTMLVVCARRHGLIANLTRWVAFGTPAPGVVDAFQRIREVESAFLDATRAGRRVDEVLADGIAGYEVNGFSPREWHNHHQGGPTGYFGRDPSATPAIHDEVVVNQAFAWNPSAPGAKVEDTVLLSADGLQRLTTDVRWPVITTRAGDDRPDLMVR